MSESGKSSKPQARTFKHRAGDRRQHQVGIDESQQIQERRGEPRRLDDELKAGEDHSHLINEFDRLIFEQTNEAMEFMKRVNLMVFHALEDIHPRMDPATSGELIAGLRSIFERHTLLRECGERLTAADRQALLADAAMQERCFGIPESLKELVARFNETFSDTPLAIPSLPNA